MSAARLSRRLNQVGDQFDIVFGHLHLMRFADPLEIGGLFVRIRHCLSPAHSQACHLSIQFPRHPLSPSVGIGAPYPIEMLIAGAN